MDKSKLVLASVDLVSGGMKGVKVQYIQPSVKGNVKFLDKYKSDRKAPIHAELEECFSWLPNYLLDLCGYTLDKEEREFLVKETEVTGVKYSDKGIILSGSLNVLNGVKKMNLTSPLVVSEIEYAEFGKLESIVKGIYVETAEYLAGKKVMSDVQIVARFNAKNEEFDHDSFKKMSKAEQREIATKILEDQGCMVFHNDEIGTEESEIIDTTPTNQINLVDMIAEVEAEKEKAEIIEEPVTTGYMHVVGTEVPEAVLTVTPKPEKVKAKKEKKAETVSSAGFEATSEAITLTSDSGDFALPLDKKLAAPKKKVA